MSINSETQARQANNASHVVADLPQYHCGLNPIKLVWSQVKGYIVRRNKMFELYDMFGFFTPALLQLIC
jgi:hypothetical protein